MSVSSTVQILEKDIYVSNIYSINQYNIEGHLITIIGEWFHYPTDEQCEGTTIPIGFLVYNLARRSPNAKVALEFPPGMNLEKATADIESRSLVSTIKILTEHKLQDRIIGYDIRYEILPFMNRKYLFETPMYISTQSGEFIIDNYVNPIIDRVIPTLLTDLETSDIKDKNYLTSFIKSIEYDNYLILKDMENYDRIKSETRKVEIMLSILHMWSKIADYRILQIIFNQLQIPNGSVIIICGKHHVIELDHIFKNQRIMTKIEPEKYKCMNLRGMYMQL